MLLHLDDLLEAVVFGAVELCLVILRYVSVWSKYIHEMPQHNAVFSKAPQTTAPSQHQEIKLPLTIYQ